MFGHLAKSASQFSLRTLLLTSLVAGAALGWIGIQLREHFAARQVTPPMSDLGSYGNFYQNGGGAPIDYPNEGQPVAEVGFMAE